MSKTLIAPKNTLNPGHFGPGVIGKSEPQQPTAAQLKHDPTLGELRRETVDGGEFEKEQDWKQQTSHGAFGPAVVGDSQPQKPTAGQLMRDPTLGPLHGVKVVDGNVVPINTPDPVAAEPAEQPVATDSTVGDGSKLIETPTKAQLRAHRQLPLDKIEETLKQSDLMFEAVMRAELKRTEGPRKKALRILLTHAQERAADPVTAEVWEPVVASLEEALKPKAV